MRGIVAIGLLSVIALLVAPAASAQGVVNSRFDGVTLSSFAGDPIDVGQGSYADLAFQFCYDAGGLVPPPDNTITVTIAVTAAPTWGTASMVQDTYAFTIAPENAAQGKCFSASPPAQVFLQLTNAVGGEAGQVDLVVSGTGAGTIKPPADAPVSTQVTVAMPAQDQLAQLQANASAATEEDFQALADEKTKDSPGFDAAFAIVVVGAVLVAAIVRRRKN